MTFTATEPVEQEPAPVKPLTVSQALAKYDAKQRAAAAKVGRPTDRAATAGIFHGDKTTLTSAVFTGVDGKVYSLDLVSDSTPVALDRQGLLRLLTDAYDLGDAEVGLFNGFVIADRDTLRRIAKMADGWAKASDALEVRRMARLMSFRMTLPVSMYTPVLTEALASRYWLPTGPDADDLGAWDVAFGHGHPHLSRRALLALIEKATDGITNKDCKNAINSGEKIGARAGQHASDSAACTAFGKAGAVTDAYNTMIAIDPTLRERNTISGTVSRIKIHQIKQNQIEAYVTDPGKLREGSKVWIFDDTADGRKIDLTLRAIEFVNERLMAILSAPASNNSNGFIIHESKAQYEGTTLVRAARPLYVVTAPFLANKKAPKNKRWMQSGGEDKVLHIDIPVDIALAGAPRRD